VGRCGAFDFWIQRVALLDLLKVLLFLPWLVSDVAALHPSSAPSRGTALCLGEGDFSHMLS
jgi:hypothetical protein